MKLQPSPLSTLPRWILTLLLVGLPLVAAPVAAGAGIWTPLGPEGADVSALAVDPTSSQIVYAGTSRGGIFKTDDGGATWRPIHRGLVRGGEDQDILTLAIDPRFPRTVYAGTTSAGVFKSIDGGRAWFSASRGLPNIPGVLPAAVYGLAIDPDQPQTLYAGTLRGVFGSRNGGLTWRPLNSGITGCTVDDLALDTSGSQLYAASVDCGFFTSFDGGATWESLQSRLPSGVTVWALATDPLSARTIWIGTNRGVFSSRDRGQHWRGPDGEETLLLAVQASPFRIFAVGERLLVSTDGRTWQAPRKQSMANQTISALAASRWAAYVGAANRKGQGGVHRSLDGGATWQPRSGGMKAVHVLALTFGVSTPPALWITTGRFYGYGGLFRSTDLGASWSLVTPPEAKFGITALAVDPGAPSRLYAASLSYGLLLRSNDDGTTWRTLHRQGQENPLCLWVDRRAPLILWAAGLAGLYRSADGGLTFARQPLTGDEHLVLIDFQADPDFPEVLYAVGSVPLGAPRFGNLPRLFRSQDGGQSWESRDSGLTGSPVHLAFDPSDSTILYLATSAGLYRSRDAGQFWEALPLTGDVSALAAVPTSPPAIYSALRGIGIFRSLDQGDTWSPLSQGLEQHTVTALSFNPQDPNHLFAATLSKGLFTMTLPKDQ